VLLIGLIELSWQINRFFDIPRDCGVEIIGPVHKWMPFSVEYVIFSIWQDSDLKSLV
jgi:hypothetical protein